MVQGKQSLKFLARAVHHRIFALMLLRYLVLFGGIVMMITGCNSLISQQFGTHQLRTVKMEEAVANGLGDADFVELDGAVLGEALIVGPALRSTDEDYVLRPILSPKQATAWSAGEKVSVKLIGWTETTDPACVQAPGCLPAAGTPIRGLLSEPTWRKNPVEDWPGQRVELSPDPLYIQLNKKPMAWYWNLALLLGGLLLAIVPESFRHRRKIAAQDKPASNA